jgi:hypothetical protein
MKKYYHTLTLVTQRAHYNWAGKSFRERERERIKETELAA